MEADQNLLIKRIDILCILVRTMYRQSLHVFEDKKNNEWGLGILYKKWNITSKITINESFNNEICPAINAITFTFELLKFN